MASETRSVRVRSLSLRRHNEKNELQELNETLGDFIQRVKQLELTNHQLRTQVDALKHNWGFDSTSVREKFAKDLSAIRTKLDATSIDLELAQLEIAKSERYKSSTQYRISFLKKFSTVNQQRATVYSQELEQTNAELDDLRVQIENKKQEIERNKGEMYQQMDYLDKLEKEYDEEMRRHVVLDIELRTFQEEILFLKAVYEEENNELSVVGSLHIDVAKFYREELARAIANIRKDFQALSAKRQQEWQEYYKSKIQEANIEFDEVQRRQVELSSRGDVVVMDFKALKTSIEESRSSFTALQTENLSLVKRQQDLEELYETLQLEQRRATFSFEQEYSLLLAEYNARKSEISSVDENNVSLIFEINTYRRLLEGVSAKKVVKTRQIALVWLNSSSANFSAMTLQASFSLQWAETFQVTGATVLLPTTFVGPKGCSGVSFSAVYYTSDERITVEATIEDQYNYFNYGQYQVTIYYMNSKIAIGNWTVQLEPKDDICMPKQLILRDSINNSIAGATVQIILMGQVVFTATSDKAGTVGLPQNLPENSYTIEIDTHSDRYKKGRLQRLVHQNRGAQSLTYFIYRQMQPDEVEFLLKWGERPSDLDSHIYVSDGRHVFFSRKQERNVSLDYDCREGGGPETIKVKLEPDMKYVYAVHRYTKDGELARSEANVTISTNDVSESGHPFQYMQVPYVNRPDANFWIVCQIDGATKTIKYFEHAFEDTDDCNTDSFIRKYYNA